MTFARDGFALLPRFVGYEELPGLREAVDETLERPLPAGCERPDNTLAPLRFGDAIVSALLSGRRTAAVSATVKARDLRFISAYISVKDPLSGPLSLHRDW